jgi:hypothetical protein
MGVLLNVHPDTVSVMQYRDGRDTHDVMLYRQDGYRATDYQIVTTTGLCDVSNALSVGEGCEGSKGNDVGEG